MKKSSLAAAIMAIAALTASAVGPAALAEPPKGCNPSNASPKKCEPGDNTPSQDVDRGTRDLTVNVSDPTGVSPIATYLQSDGGKRFGTRWVDYDIATELVLWAVGQDPTSAVSVLTDGKVALTMFVPTDAAFRNMVRDLTGENLKNEEAVFNAITDLGFDTVEKVLLYHVVLKSDNPGENLLNVNGRSLLTAEGSRILVSISSSRTRVVHSNADMKTPVVNSKRPMLNEGNLQKGFRINRVLMP